ncbi:hypothetical protein BGZ94_003291 [Podila epigama]|nr:hypothetical protein BGZ94_003291 [Podila epigama]
MEDQDEQQTFETASFRYHDSILQPIDVRPPLTIFPRHPHPVKPVHIHPEDANSPLPTNKFYGNLLLGDAHAPIWTHPYGLRWDKHAPGFLRRTATQQGLSISHIDDSSKAFGPWNEHQAPRFYINPFLVSMSLSATELTPDHNMTVGDFTEFGCTLVLSPESEKDRLHMPTTSITVPIVRGMAFITGIYKNMTPKIFSNILVRTLTLDTVLQGNEQSKGWVKHRFLLENGVTWLVYSKSDDIHAPPLRFELQGQEKALAISGKFTGLMQIAKLPIGDEQDAEATFDRAKGVYPTRGNLVVRHAFVQGDEAEYRIDWSLEGDTTASFIHFTLPHHRSILTSNTTRTSIELDSTTKGMMIAYEGASWRLFEPERLVVDFLPRDWATIITTEQLAEIRKQAALDVEMDFMAATNLNSMYFAGKGLAKLALLCLVIRDVLNDTTEIYEKCLAKLKVAFQRFLDNDQQYPLVYDTTWKGLISIQGLEKGPLADFGNTWYNDHHYHYGYFIHTAAILRYLDPVWNEPQVNDFVGALLRDVANPSPEDTHFPVFRSFDWYMGHSWSQGIFVSLDGKDEESTSEDINLYYAMSLWGRVAGEPELEKLGQVMLTIARRSIQDYFLLEVDNKNHPPAFIRNHVTGILFENKVDHISYFSPRIECIQGIQMIPATPALPLVRRKDFVQQEWDALLRSRVDSIDDGWRSILMMNYATLDKVEAWRYFTERPNVPLDDGMTKTWALFYVASQQP